MSFEYIIYERKGQIAYLTLNRPEKLNAVNGELMAEFRDAMGVVEADTEVRALIITGAGRAFSSGFDIQRSNQSGDPLAGTPDAWRTRLLGLVETFMTVWNCSKPVIAAVNGYALGGACELVQVCDIKIASDRAVMGEPEIRAGFGPPLLITPYSVNLANAKELLLTGDTVDAHEAARIGLVNRVVKGGEKVYHCGGGIVYHRHDEKGLNWEPGGIRSGAGVRSSGVSQESTGSSDTWEAALCRLCLRR